MIKKKYDSNRGGVGRTADNPVVIQAVVPGFKALSSKYLLRMLSKLNTVQTRSKYFRVKLIWVRV